MPSTAASSLFRQFTTCRALARFVARVLPPRQAYLESGPPDMGIAHLKRASHDVRFSVSSKFAVITKARFAGMRLSRHVWVALLLVPVLWPWPARAAAPLRVTHARLDNDTPQSGNTGRVILKAVIDDSGSGGSFEDALLTNTVVITIQDAGQFNVTAPLTGCMRAGSGIRCSSGSIRAKLKHTSTPAMDRLRLSVRQLASGSTGTTQPSERVRVTVRRQGSADLVDVISDCEAVGQSRLGCRDRDRPNIIFIVTDDQRWDTSQYMPTVLDQLASRGVTFTNAFVTSPTCAPSRASMLTGQYARNHGVLTLSAPDGGATRFVGADASTLATWLHDAGYRTGMYGKYLTDYNRQCPPFTTTCYIPPGWDEWHVFTQQHYYNYQLAENDQITTFGSTPVDYSTDVIAAKAVEFIATADGQPFFLHVGFHAPHQEGGADPIPAPRHEHMYDGIVPWRPPSWDEEDISDKPPWVALQPRAATPLGAFLTYGFWGDFIRQRQIETLAAVDEAVDAMLAALEATGQADNTVVVFTSDNGYLWGEHRYFFGKAIPQEESIRIPLIIRFPRLGTVARTESRMALNIDLAPTLARLADVEPPSTIDGANLEPLLTGVVTPWRDDFVVELWFPPGSSQPSYTGIRAQDWLYVPYPSVGEAELYDLVDDPYQLDNRAHDVAYQDVVAELQARLDALLISP